MLQTPESGIPTHAESEHWRGSRPAFCLQGPLLGGNVICPLRSRLVAVTELRISAAADAIWHQLMKFALLAMGEDNMLRPQPKTILKEKGGERRDESNSCEYTREN
jgi:hypothetical protein